MGSIEWEECERGHLDAEASLAPMSPLGVVSVLPVSVALLLLCQPPKSSPRDIAARQIVL